MNLFKEILLKTTYGAKEFPSGKFIFGRTRGGFAMIVCPAESDFALTKDLFMQMREECKSEGFKKMRVWGTVQAYQVIGSKFCQFVQMTPYMTELASRERKA